MYPVVSDHLPGRADSGPVQGGTMLGRAQEQTLFAQCGRNASVTSKGPRPHETAEPGPAPVTGLPLIIVARDEVGSHTRTGVF